jgi:hypothetical protein
MDRQIKAAERPLLLRVAEVLERGYDFALTRAVRPGFSVGGLPCTCQGLEEL